MSSVIYFLKIELGIHLDGKEKMYLHLKLKLLLVILLIIEIVLYMELR